jgi:sugar O-acyltransferase (sialic acid O-acetyltransferase NeuD family)
MCDIVLNYNIVGHCNEVLAGLLDILYKKNILKVNIISNVEPDFMVPYKIEQMDINEYHITDFVFENGNNYIMGVNSPKSKRQVHESFKEYVTVDMYMNIIPNEIIFPEKIKLGRGININFGVTIGPFTEIHNFVTINRNTSIGHHNIIEEYVTISPGVNIAGHVKIKKNTLIGIGAVILNNITIGENVIIGAGSVVTKDIPDNSVWYGVPAKFIRYN